MLPSLNVIFAGTPEFAAIALAALIDSTHNVIAVFCQPDRPSGRGLKVNACPVKTLAQQFQLPLHQPASLKDSYEQDILRSYKADVMVVAAYGLLLPAAVLTIPRLGCINIHPSLLPRWRGAAPIERTILAGDKKTGVCTMQMDTGLDTGDILVCNTYDLTPDETSVSLHEQLATLGAKTLLQTLRLLAEHKLTATKQATENITYAHKISKEEALIDWQQDAITLLRMIRAFNPRPIAHTSWQAQPLRIWDAEIVGEAVNAPPRTIVHACADGIDIATGKGVLRLLKVQLPGGKVISAGDFYNAKRHQLLVGEHFS